MTNEPTYIDPLQELGLTGLEARVYGYLLRHSPATGYGVAKGIGKPVANTYKALASLRARGAAVADDDRTRAYRAVPPSELFAALERQFAGRRERAARALSGITAADDDERVYQLRTPDQVIERFRQMLLRARHVAVFELHPWAVDRLSRDISAASDRGVRMFIAVEERTEVPGAHVVVSPRVRAVLRDPAAGHAGGHPDDPADGHANGVIDGAEHLFARMSRDGARVYRAIWTQSEYLSSLAHRTLVAELFYGAVGRGLSRGLSVDELEEAFEFHESIRAMGTGKTR